MKYAIEHFVPQVNGRIQRRIYIWSFNLRTMFYLSTEFHIRFSCSFRLRTLCLTAICEFWNTVNFAFHLIACNSKIIIVIRLARETSKKRESFHCFAFRERSRDRRFEYSMLVHFYQYNIFEPFERKLNKRRTQFRSLEVSRSDTFTWMASILLTKDKWNEIFPTNA